MSFETIILALFIVWGIPLGLYRSKWRKMVYQTDSWLINIQPYFWRELKVLFGFIKLDKAEERKLCNFYRIYLIGYFGLLFGYLLLK